MVHDHVERIMYLSIELNCKKMGLFSQCVRQLHHKDAQRNIRVSSEMKNKKNDF